MIYLIIDIEPFGHQSIIIKGLFKCEPLKQHMITINSDLYEHIFLENIKKLLKSAAKCDDQQQYKFIFEAEIVSNT